MLSSFAYVTSVLTDRLRRDDRGATMVEYGLMLALIAVVCVVIVGTIGTNLLGVFTTIANNV